MTQFPSPFEVEIDPFTRRHVGANGGILLRINTAHAERARKAVAGRQDKDCADKVPARDMKEAA